MRAHLAVACLFLTALPAYADSAPIPPGMVAVRGYGEVEIPVAKAELSLLVFTTAGDMAKLADKHADRTAKAEAVIASFKDKGIVLDQSDLQSGDLGENCQKPSCTLSSERYFDRTTYRLNVSTMAVLNDSITAFAKSGVLRLENVSYDVASHAIAENAARKAAILDARDKVVAYAEALNVDLGNVREIHDPEADAVARAPAMMALAAPMAKSAQLPSDGRELKITPPKTITYTHSVDVTWWLQPSKTP